MTNSAKSIVEATYAKNADEGEVIVSVNNISKKFCKNLKRSMAYGIVDLSKNLLGKKPNSTELRRDEFWAIDDISFELKKGEALGLIGVNGSGKTTLLRLLAGIFPPDKGEIIVKGRVGALIAVGAGFHPHMTGRENIYLNGAILGMSREEINSKFQDIVDFAEIANFLDAPVSTYSSGMRVRLGFSIATAIHPDLLLLDEILAVGDRPFRLKCFQRIGEILEKSAVIFVSHDIVQISRICNWVMMLHKGRNVFAGETETGIEKYLESIHDTSRRLPKLIMNKTIKDFSCNLSKDTLKYGETLKIELSFDAKQEIETGICLINLSTDDAIYGQTDFSSLLGRINQGKSVLRLEIGPLYLNNDEYSIHVTITGASRKNTLIHCLHSAIFRVLGPKGFGVHYQVPIVTKDNDLKDIP